MYTLEYIKDIDERKTQIMDFAEKLFDIEVYDFKIEDEFVIFEKSGHNFIEVLITDFAEKLKTESVKEIEEVSRVYIKFKEELVHYVNEYSKTLQVLDGHTGPFEVSLLMPSKNVVVIEEVDSDLFELVNLGELIDNMNTPNTLLSKISMKIRKLFNK